MEAEARKEAVRLHDEAMRLADEAAKASDSDSRKRFYWLAFNAESKAAELFQDKLDMEPLRSILYLGAAGLAMDSGHPELSGDFIREAYAGNPPAIIVLRLVALEAMLAKARLEKSHLTTN